MLEFNIITWYIYFHVCGINGRFMMPHSAANALNPRCMRSVVVTVLSFAHQAVSFVCCLVRPAGRFCGALLLWRNNSSLANLFLVCLHRIYPLCALWQCVHSRDCDNVVRKRFC